MLFFRQVFFVLEPERAHARDECRGKLALAAALDVEKADDREDDRTDEVDQKVLHGVHKPNIDIAAVFCDPVLAVDQQAVDVDVLDDIQPVRIE